MNEIEFRKYHQMGAYHWKECSNNLRRINPYLKARYEIILECIKNLGVTGKHKILDVGCGDGALTGKIYDKCRCEIFGIDPVDMALDLAKSKFAEFDYKGNFQKVTGYSYNFPDGIFDIVVCADVIEHVQEPLSMLGEIKRVLKPGGHLIISTPVRFTEVPLDEMHVQEWYVNEFVDICSDVFGKPEKVILSHPVVFYELYNINYKYVRIIMKALIKLLACAHINVFKSKNTDVWKCYSVQTLVLASKQSFPQVSA